MLTCTLLGWTPEVLEWECEECGGDLVSITVGWSIPTRVVAIGAGGMCNECQAQWVWPPSDEEVARA